MNTSSSGEDARVAPGEGGVRSETADLPIVSSGSLERRVATRRHPCGASTTAARKQQFHLAAARLRRSSSAACGYQDRGESAETRAGGIDRDPIEHLCERKRSRLQHLHDANVRSGRAGVNQHTKERRGQHRHQLFAAR